MLTVDLLLSLRDAPVFLPHTLVDVFFPASQCSKAVGNGSGSNDSQSSELQAGYGFGSDEGSNPTGPPLHSPSHKCCQRLCVIICFSGMSGEVLRPEHTELY